MMDGFNLDSPLVCEGIVGDGCGGGRIFFVEDSKLKVYDPITKERMILLENLGDIKSISKAGCIISLKSENENRLFDLSSLK